MTDDQIESVLRQAPQPPPPAGLCERLETDIPRPAHVLVSAAPSPTGWRNWLGRLLPATAYALAMLACVTVLAVQARSIAQLRQENQRLRSLIASLPQAQEEHVEVQKLTATAREIDGLRRKIQELPRWRQEAEALRTQVADLAAIRADNQRLRLQAAATSTSDEVDPLTDARNKARSIQCVSHLKQIGLAARLWANDNQDRFPASFQVMSNELSSTKVLVCPEDGAREAAAAAGTPWAELTPQHATYQFLAAGLKDTDNPSTIICRCPIHDHVTLLDGSVLQAGWRKAEPLQGRYVLKP